MTSGSWFSGSRLSSMNCMASSPSVRFVADDPGPLHFPDGGPVIHDGIMLSAAVIPDGDTVRPPPPAHLVLRNRGARDQIIEQVRSAGGIVLPVPYVLGRVEIGEMRREAVHKQHPLGRLRMLANDRMLGIRELLLQAMPLLDRHACSKARLNRMACIKSFDAVLDVIREVFVGARHVRPNGVATDRRAFDASKDGALRRLLAPGRVTVPGIFVMVRRGIEGL